MRKPDPVEIVAIAVPVLLEAVSVVLMLGMAFVWLAVYRGLPT